MARSAGFHKVGAPCVDLAEIDPGLMYNARRRDAVRPPHQPALWIAMAAVVTLMSVGCGREVTDPDPGEGPAPAVSHRGGISWETDWDAAFERAQSDDRVVLVDVYADWCVWCRRLDSTTYRDERVVRFVEETMVPLKVNADRDVHRVDDLRVSGLPTILVLSPDGRELGRIPGYLPASGFLEAVREIVERT